VGVDDVWLATQQRLLYESPLLFETVARSSMISIRPDEHREPITS
jgi:hypothetical protein